MPLVEAPVSGSAAGAGVDEAGLIERAAAGDGAAFHTLIDSHMDRLFRLAVSMVGNTADAEDVLQETFAGAYRGLGNFEGRASVRTWLTRICVTQSALWLREKKRKKVEAIGEREFAADWPESERPSDVSADVRAAMIQLSPDHREVLVLREFERMSYEDIANVLGVAQGTVESRLFRARAELRKLLQAYLP